MPYFQERELVGRELGYKGLYLLNFVSRTYSTCAIYMYYIAYVLHIYSMYITTYSYRLILFKKVYEFQQNVHESRKAEKSQSGEEKKMKCAFSNSSQNLSRFFKVKHKRH